MSEKDEFYIGWQDDAPSGFRKIGWVFFIAVLVFGMGFAVFFSRAEVGFVDSYFDYGNLSEVKGQLVLEPVPALLTVENGQRKSIPLVGFGKFGAGPILDGFRSKLTGDLSNYEVTIRGTYFEYQDKRWMELTEGEESLVNFVAATQPNRKIVKQGNTTLSGEIIDPKCFFGVMNPATKAVHRSCARRCISGGIVPVLGIRQNGQFVDYYLLEEARSENIFKDILPFVGLPITISGEVTRYDDWKVLAISSKSLADVAIDQFATIAMCQKYE